jgi:NAD(P)-dependent dehydrogenase (short-subunit alcohol dehydrogenase family)
MGVCAVTGSASGMGHKVAQRLCDAGHTLIGPQAGRHRRGFVDRRGASGCHRPCSGGVAGQTGRRRASGRSRARPGR